MADQPALSRNKRRSSRQGLPMSERQLDAYLLTRDTLRRLRNTGRAGSAAPPPSGRR